MSAAALIEAARFAVLAPSSHNSQPWRFVINGDRLDLKADRARALPVVDPDDRELVISCGAALYHLRLALRHAGWVPSIELMPGGIDGDIVATVRLAGERRAPTAEEERLFAAIERRHTNRSPFAARDVPEKLRFELIDVAQREGAWLYIAFGIAKEAVATLISEADRLQMDDPRFRRELASWLHPSRSELGDGMPGNTQGLSDLAARFAPLVVRTFDLGGSRAARDHQLAVGSPLLTIIGTERDDATEWLRAGQALAAVLLYATDVGLAASFLNQPVEVPALRVRLHEVLGKSGLPQLVLRLGYPLAEVPATPRRPMREVVRETP
ncbi:MAG: Acg family FMN-binding oxidoreductase [Polyangia bacterium]